MNEVLSNILFVSICKEIWESIEWPVRGEKQKVKIYIKLKEIE